MPTRKGWDDIIPARGEARVLAEVKGAYGSKGGRMRGRRSSKMSRLRSGVQIKKKPLILLPLGPPPVTVETGGESTNIQQIQYIDGALGTSIYGRWLFAMTPERLSMDDMNISPLFGASDWGDIVSGSMDQGAQISKRYRIIGMRGDIFYTPQRPNGDGQTPEQYSGMMGYAWMKVRAQGAPDSEGHPSYPFATYGGTDVTTGINDRGYTPRQAVSAYNGRLDNIDWRLSQAKNSIIKYGMMPWSIPNQVNTVFDDGGNVTQELRYALGGARSIRIPILKKCAVDVGRGESLALVMWQKDFEPNGENGGAPIGRLDYHTFRVVVHEID